MDSTYVWCISMTCTTGGSKASNSIGPRLRNYLVGPLASGHPGRYHRYDWHLGRFADWVSVPRTELLILEGVGAGHPNIASRRASLVWIDADPDLCLARGLARDGEGMRDQWLDWKVKEAAYFAHHSVRRACRLHGCHDQRSMKDTACSIPSSVANVAVRARPLDRSRAGCCELIDHRGESPGAVSLVPGDRIGTDAQLGNSPSPVGLIPDVRDDAAGDPGTQSGSGGTRATVVHHARRAREQPFVRYVVHQHQIRSQLRHRCHPSKVGAAAVDQARVARPVAVRTRWCAASLRHPGSTSSRTRRTQVAHPLPGTRSARSAESTRDLPAGTSSPWSAPIAGQSAGGGTTRGEAPRIVGVVGQALSIAASERWPPSGRQTRGIRRAAAPGEPKP